MARKDYTAEIVKINDLTPSVRDLFFEVNEPFEFKAGQFIMINLIDPSTGKKVQRAYSVASTEKNKNGFNLIIKFYEFGVASLWVKSLKEGEEITFAGPFGKFFFKETPQKNVVFVATATGLAPFYAMLTSSCEKFKDVNYHVLMGVWNEVKSV